MRHAGDEVQPPEVPLDPPVAAAKRKEPVIKRVAVRLRPGNTPNTTQPRQAESPRGPSSPADLPVSGSLGKSSRDRRPGLKPPPPTECSYERTSHTTANTCVSCNNFNEKHTYQDRVSSGDPVTFFGSM